MHTAGLDLRPTNGLFEEPWWLDAVAPGAWGAVEVSTGGQVEARLAYGTGRLLGMLSLRQPPLTQTLGPWYRPREGKLATRLAREKDLADELVARLPAHGFFSLNFHPDVVNWLPYHWLGFDAEPKVTYVLEDLSSEPALWDGLQENIRREVRKAEKAVEVIESDDLDVLLALHRKTFSRQGLHPTLDESLLRRVDEACAARSARRLLIARDERGNVHAFNYTVHDDRRCYYVLGGGDPELRRSGAGSLLMWRAIRHAAQTSRAFDFEGSMGESIERFFRSFGARQAIYLNLRRSGRFVGAALGFRQALRALSRPRR